MKVIKLVRKRSTSEHRTTVFALSKYLKHVD